MKFLDDMAELSLANRCATDQTGQLLFYPWGKRRKGYVIPSPEKKEEIKAVLREGIKYAYLYILFWLVGGFFGATFLVRLYKNQELDKQSLQYWVLGFSVLAPACFLIPIWNSVKRAAQGLQRAPDGVVLSSPPLTSKKDELVANVPLRLKLPSIGLYVLAFLLFILGAADYVIFSFHNPYSLTSGVTGLFVWWTIAMGIAVTAALKMRKLTQLPAESTFSLKRLWSSKWLWSLVFIAIPVFSTLWIMTEGVKKKTGYINQAGKVVLPLRYVRAEPFSEGLARVVDFSEDRQLLKFTLAVGLSNLLSRKGHTSELWKEYIEWGYIDKTGQVVFPSQFADATDFHEGLAGVKLGSPGKWGYINKTGRIVIQPQYAVAGSFSEGLAEVQTESGGKWGYINKSGQVVISFQFADAWKFSDGLAPVQTESGGKWGYIDKGGTVVISPQFVKAWSFSDGLAIVHTETGGKSGYIDKSGQVVIQPKLYGAWPFSEGLANVLMEKNGKWGYIDKSGQVVIKPQFANAYPFSEGLAHVRDAISGKWGYIDKTGQAVIPFQFGDAWKFSEGLAAFREFIE